MSITPNRNGDRNAVPLHAIPNLKVIWHFLADIPLRASALRGSAPARTFSPLRARWTSSP
jgi:hypothetical protein